MSFILCLFLQFAFFALCINSQQTAFDRDNCEDGDSNLADIRQSLERIQQRLEHLNNTRSSTDGAKEPPCPPGFRVMINGFYKCYSVVTQLLNWNAAQENCRQLHPNAHLVVISNVQESQILSQIVSGEECHGGRKNFWTSGQRRNHTCQSKTFVWKPNNRTNLEFSHKNWCHEEPTCGNGQHCVCFRKYCYYQPDSDGWDDIECDDLLCSVCEVVRIVFT